MKKKNKSITTSPRHGLNAAMVKCFVCGNDTNEIALMGKIDKEDSRAPNYIMTGSLCDECKNYINDGGSFIIEASDKYGTMTGRYAKLHCKLKEGESPIAYMLPEDFENLVKDIEKQKK